MEVGMFFVTKFSLETGGIATGCQLLPCLFSSRDTCVRPGAWRRTNEKVQFTLRSHGGKKKPSPAGAPWSPHVVRHEAVVLEEDRGSTAHGDDLHMVMSRYVC